MAPAKFTDKDKIPSRIPSTHFRKLTLPEDGEPHHHDMMESDEQQKTGSSLPPFPFLPLRTSGKNQKRKFCTPLVGERTASRGWKAQASTKQPRVTFKSQRGERDHLGRDCKVFRPSLKGEWTSIKQKRYPCTTQRMSGGKKREKNSENSQTSESQ